MRNRLWVLTVVAFAFAGLAMAGDEAGEKLCPVSGEKIDPATAVELEHAGTTYQFCCKKCLRRFEDDPESYLKKDDPVDAEQE